jgi:enoyl-CoA hydratase/carnithine racemase
MKPFLAYAHSGPIVTLTMDAPESRNALTGGSAPQEFVDACARITDDASVRVVVLTGAGSVFSSGGNLKHMQSLIVEPPIGMRQWNTHGIHRVPTPLYKIQVPTIAAVNGPAIGAGCDLTCMCDIRIAAENASFAESFVKVGLIAGDGGAWLLPRVVGMSKASEMAFTGDTLSAEEALACGLVSRVVAADRLLPEALALAARIAANPGTGLRLTKRLLREGQHMRLESLLEMSAAFQAVAHKTAHHVEAINAFVEKRKPDFSGE